MGQDRALTDDELLSVYKNPQADLSLLSREERNRLVTLTDPKTTPPAPAGPSLTDRAVDLLPMAGGTVGGIVGGIGGTFAGMGIGGVPGAIGGATLGGGAGEAAKQLINRFRGAAAPDSPSAAAGDIALQGGLQGVAEAVGAGVTKGVGMGARAVYRGYLKPSLAAKNLPKAAEVVETALNEGLPLTRGGAGVEAGGKITGKAGQIIQDMRDEVKSILAQTPGKQNLVEIGDKLRAFARRKYFKPGGDPADYQAALAVADRIDRHPSLGLPAGTVPSRVDVSATQLDEIKRGLQSGASSSFGVPNAAAKADAEKMASHVTRKAEERLAGSQVGASGQTVAQLNKRESKLIDAAKAIAQAVEREANQSKLYGVKTLAATAYGGSRYAQGDSPTEAIAKGLAARALLQPGTQSYAAIVANRIAKQLGVGAATAARLAAVALAESNQPEQ